MGANDLKSAEKDKLNQMLSQLQRLEQLRHARQNLISDVKKKSEMKTRQIALIIAVMLALFVAISVAFAMNLLAASSSGIQNILKFTIVIFVIGTGVFYLFVKFLMTRGFLKTIFKTMADKAEVASQTQKNDLLGESQQIIQNPIFTQSDVPSKYFNIQNIRMILRYFDSGQAYSIKMAVSLFENDLATQADHYQNKFQNEPTIYELEVQACAHKGGQTID
ncbi:hypothetical protein Hs30E_05260 [Lactococcus hodotermopsidis]|uniref:Uncharacterized protein n=1 Tax=Pseudolactococcus hodotermopsidis TaxID=2709157 RepID=A0A6A0BBE7_9LACT|nr:hypothetical protein [Lactococcus hodotermopsidis]GFH41975.1 hypothetical protein Hs30E_05260 [Lactococcus hodotermopsidis]